ncbi:hypothetical protein MD484_g1050, partial [Candolleomyces efflorescens]
MPGLLIAPSFTSLHSFIISSFFLVALIKLRNWLAWRRANPKSLPYPPGPTCWPIIGNLFDLARENESAKYNLMSKKYGDLFFLSIMGQNLLFVNSFKVAYDLFERKSSIYSDRKRSIMINELLLRSPSNLINHLRLNAGGVIMGVTYGIEDESENDRLEPKDDNASIQEVIRNCAGLAYAASAESTTSTLTTFILAMVLNPQALHKAQAELDEVVGHSRLPDEKDRPHLPYVGAIVKEVLRWNPVAPLGLPHMLSQDDEYNGTILRDPEVFPDPHAFKPERFLNDDSQECNISPLHPLSSAFGYGRRACPGRFMAEQQLFITIATILALFEIGPGLDEKGSPARVEARFTSGMICHPVPFEYTIKPRGEYVNTLLES